MGIKHQRETLVDSSLRDGFFSARVTERKLWLFSGALKVSLLHCVDQILIRALLKYFLGRIQVECAAHAPVCWEGLDEEAAIRGKCSCRIGQVIYLEVHTLNMAEHGTTIPFQMHCFNIDFELLFLNPDKSSVSKQGSWEYQRISKRLA